MHNYDSLLLYLYAWQTVQLTCCFHFFIQGGALALTICYPLETVRTRLQGKRIIVFKITIFCLFVVVSFWKLLYSVNIKGARGRHEIPCIHLPIKPSIHPAHLCVLKFCDIKVAIYHICSLDDPTKVWVQCEDNDIWGWLSLLIHLDVLPNIGTLFNLE